MRDSIVDELEDAEQHDDNPWDNTLYSRAANEIRQQHATITRLHDAGDALAHILRHHLEPADDTQTAAYKQALKAWDDSKETERANSNSHLHTRPQR